MELVAEKYKKTDIGSIPNDWEVKAIGQEIDLITGFPFPSSGYSESGIRLLRCSNVKRGVTDWSEGIVQYWSKITSELKPYILNEGDIVIAMDGSLVGRSFARLTQIDLPAILLQRVARIRSNKIDVGYLKEFVCSDYFTKYCDTVKTSSAIPHISPSDIRGFVIPIPPTKAEQTAIAAALSDADDLISSLEKLIAKKRNIKQGAMQKLLQPKDGWEVKKLGDVAQIYQPQTISQDVFIDDGYLVYGANGVVGKYHLFNHDTWQTTITCRGSTCGTVNRTIGKSWITGNAMVMNVDNNRNINKLFFYYILTKQDFNQCITGSGQPQIVRTPLFEFKITIPKTINEQTEIATILSDMDAEISALETKLEKYKKVKLGMMQNLLTGKIRLV